MELHKKAVCECESKSYSITEIKLYSFPKDLKYFIPEYLKENWNYIVYNTKCIHSWIALLKHVSRKQLPCIIETKLLYYFVRSNLAIHRSDTPFVIRQPIHRPHLLERVYKPIRTPHWCRDLLSLLLRTLEIGCK